MVRVLYARRIRCVARVDDGSVRRARPFGWPDAVPGVIDPTPRRRIPVRVDGKGWIEKGRQWLRRLGFGTFARRRWT